jgi:hypothetical protein
MQSTSANLGTQPGHLNDRHCGPGIFRRTSQVGGRTTIALSEKHSPPYRLTALRWLGAALYAAGNVRLAEDRLF